MIEEPRVGVFVCHCGLNIAGTIDVKKVVENAKAMSCVVDAREYVFMCSAPGQDLIKEDIKKFSLNRVVVASCSPAMHEATFRACIAEAGLNRYVLEMANIREQCSWVYLDKQKATETATDLIRMAVAKARLLEPLEELMMGVEPTSLVLGGGVAGLKASLDLAERGHRVLLVEKLPTLGGKAARLGKLAHVDSRGVEMVQSLIGAVAANPKVTVYVNSELVDLKGSMGAFEAKIKVAPRFVNEKCTLCEECFRVCPIEIPNEYEFGLSKRKAIYLPFREAYPRIPVIDPQACTRCGECVKVCKPGAIMLDQEGEVFDLAVGAVTLAIGFQPYEPPEGEYGYGRSDKVLTLFQLERLLDKDGPTAGELKLGESIPRSLAFILCVGSLSTTENAQPYCSRMCCASSLKNMLTIKERYPDTEIYALYKDIRTYGRGDEGLYERATESLVKFIRFEEPPHVSLHSDRVDVEVYDATLQEDYLIPVDAVVLSVGMSPSEDLDRIRAVVKVGCSPEGFLREAHLKLRPVEAPTDGILLAGSVTSPKNIAESVMAGGASAAKAAALFGKKEVKIEPIVAEVAEEICSGCGVCVAMCPYGAISRKEKGEKKVAQVDKRLCKACGACVAACPSGAMQQAGFKDIQVIAQVAALSERRGG
jgi:heterodisulfide reductase subunit A